MFDLKDIRDYLKGRSDAEKAKISAYILAPGLLLGLSISGVLGGELAIDLGRPIVISELKTETTAGGDPAPRRGIVLIAEPVSSEFRVQIKSNSPRIWSSLGEEEARANGDHIALDAGGLKGRTPFIGVNAPVAVVVEGEVGKDVQIPGSTERVEDWLISSRRSSSIVSSVLLACVFAFGMSLATGLPPVERDKEATG